MIKYEIWQAPINCPWKYMHYDWIKGDKPNVKGYVMVYSGLINTYFQSEKLNSILEDIFERHNIDYPSDYHAAPLSVSDVICLMTDYNKREWYYVDGNGFVRLNNWE